MTVRYWHRREGAFDQKPGTYHRTSWLPEFWQQAAKSFPTLQYRREWRAYWIPEYETYRFELWACRRGVDQPCSRCCCGVECGAWQGTPLWSPGDQGVPDPWADGWQQDYEAAYQEINGAFSAQGGPVRQQTYGRQVDAAPRPPLDWHIREAERRAAEAKRARENVVQMPVDVKGRAATLLGVGIDAEGAEIQQAVRRLAMQHHPDRGGDAARVIEVLEARDIMLGRSPRRRRC